MLDSILSLLGLKKKGVDNRQGYAGMSANELAKVGTIPVELNELTLAGQRWKNAQVFVPVMYRIIRVCLLIVGACFLIMIGSVLFRKSPLLLVSFPNGSVRCGGQNIDMARQILKPRTAEQQQICDFLEQRWTTPLTNADDEAVALAKQAQEQTPSQSQTEASSSTSPSPSTPVETQPSSQPTGTNQPVPTSVQGAPVQPVPASTTQPQS